LRLATFFFFTAWRYGRFVLPAGNLFFASFLSALADWTFLSGSSSSVSKAAPSEVYSAPPPTELVFSSFIPRKLSSLLSLRLDVAFYFCGLFCGGSLSFGGTWLVFFGVRACLPTCFFWLGCCVGFFFFCGLATTNLASCCSLSPGFPPVSFFLPLQFLPGPDFFFWTTIWLSVFSLDASEVCVFFLFAPAPPSVFWRY